MILGTGITGLHGFAQVAAARLLDSLLQGTVLALLAAVIFPPLRRYGSRLRFALWFVFLIAMLLAPVWPLAWTGGAGAWSPAHAALTLPGSWGLYLFALWGVMAGIGLVQVVAGLWRIRRLRSSCVEINPDALPPEVRRTLAQFRPRRKVTLCTSHAVGGPSALGFFRPLIALPASLIDELAPEDLNRVLLHELAHVRRCDDWSNLAQKVVRALLFFHPVVWWIERRISLEREMACDEAVIAATANPRAYAECLAFLAERSYLRRGLHLVQAAAGRMQQTTARVAKLLGENRAITLDWKATVPLTGVLLSVSLVLMAHMPELVAFKNSRVLAAPGEMARVQIKDSGALAAPMMADARAHGLHPLPGMARMTTVPVHSTSVMPRVRLAVFSAHPRKPATTLARSRAPRVNRTAGAPGDVVLVVFEQGQQVRPGSAVWQIRVWQVILVRHMTKVEDAPRKAI